MRFPIEKFCFIHVPLLSFCPSATQSGTEDYECIESGLPGILDQFVEPKLSHKEPAMIYIPSMLFNKLWSFEHDTRDALGLHED